MCVNLSTANLSKARTSECFALRWPPQAYAPLQNTSSQTTPPPPASADSLKRSQSVPLTAELRDALHPNAVVLRVEQVGRGEARCLQYIVWLLMAAYSILAIVLTALIIEARVQKEGGKMQPKSWYLWQVRGG